MPFGATAAVGLAANTVIGVYQGMAQLKEAKDLEKYYEDALDNYQREERTNAFKGLRPSTMREEIAREDIGASTATQLEMVGKLGVAGYGALPQIQRNERQVLDSVASSYEEKQQRIQELIAGDEQRLQQMQFAQENQELNALNAGYSSALQAKSQAQQNIFGSIQSGISGGTSILQGIGEQNLVRDMYGIPKEESDFLYNLKKTYTQTRERLGYRPPAPNPLEYSPYGQSYKQYQAPSNTPLAISQ